MKLSFPMRRFSLRKAVRLLSAAALLFLFTAGPQAKAQLSPEVEKQMQEVYAFKESLTPAEQKMSTNLVLLSRLAQGKLPAKLARFVHLPQRNGTGRFAVEVRGHMSATLLNSAVMQGVDKENGQVPASAFRTGRVRAHLRESDLLKLAQQADVLSVREPSRVHTNVGSLTSQGYVSMGANRVVPAGITGAGVRVGVLSDSAYPDRVAALIASGDLPADTVVLPGQAGPSDNSGENEGTAMMEIVHDIAPGAKLFFATAFNSEESFAANIRSLRFDYGCDIIVDDVGYSDESPFQDGPISQAVNDITAAGGLYFSSAANSGNLSSGTSGTWEGDFTSGGPSGALISTREGTAVTLHNFGTAATPQTYDVLRSAAPYIDLNWSDALGVSTNDYDLFVLNAAGTSIVGLSIDRQDGTSDPLEEVYTGVSLAAGDRIVVALYSGVTRALHLSTNRATLTIATSGATIGHNAAASTFSTAAVYWNAARRGPSPFVGGSTNPDESFSSDGPRKIFYNPDGSPITPGNFLFATSGGTTLIKPDAAAADGVSTATPGFYPFFGTSAAAPHAAAVAALVKSANPSLTNTQIRQILTGTALDNMSPGIDRDSGYGIITALPAVQTGLATPAQNQ